jgi:hypothetical protein
MNARTTISDEYLEQQKALHQRDDYGVASLNVAPMIAQLIRAKNIRSVSDYGAGKQNLKHGLAQQGISEIKYYPYDPVFPEYGDPRSADLVCCIDVMEHIEPEYVEAVIDELHEITKNMGFLSIATGPANKTLPDGRNAHLIQKPACWWLPLISKKFEVLNLWRSQSNLFMTIERAKPA